MKSQIRYQCFETNSSSVHSLVVSGEGLSPNKLKMKDGYVIADFGNFGTEYKLYKSQNDKLSYLLTECYYLNHYNTDLTDCYYFDKIVEAIQAHDPTVLGVKVLNKKEPYIDHQSIPEYGESNFVNYYDEQSIINFLFNKYIMFQTNCD